MTKTSSSADAVAEATANQSGASAQGGRTNSRPPTKAGGPIRSQSHGSRKRPPPYSDLGREAPTSAQRRAAAILEVLAGEQTAAQAARALGISSRHYSLLERRALQGLVAACVPRPKGPAAVRPEQELVRLRRELERSQRQCQRQTALVRATQRALGFPAMAPSKPPKAKDKPEAAGGKRSRRRQATVRALRAAQCLRENSSGPAEADVVEPSSAQGSPTEASLPRPATGLPSSPLAAETSRTGVQEFRHDTDGTQAVGHGTRGPPAGLRAGQAATDGAPGDASRRASGSGGLPAAGDLRVAIP